MKAPTGAFMLFGMDPIDALLRLHYAGGHCAWLRRLLERSADASEALHGPESAWLAAGAPAAARRMALEPQAKTRVGATRQWLEAAPQRHAIGWGEADYPSLLRHAPSPPAVLFVEGHMERLWWPQIAVVGSRAPTSAGLQRAARFARAFADAGFVVTSGLASGIDGAAHAACLREPGTIAVMATGSDLCFPPAHAALKSAIVEQGCVITEHAPGVQAKREHFPSRNRIIAGLSLATVVVEAAERSGALITARLAAESGREVFALPGSPENPKARGCHRLIREGVTLADDPAQVIEALAGAASQAAPRLRQRLERMNGQQDMSDLFSKDSSPESPPHTPRDAIVCSPEHAPVLAALGDEGAAFDDLLERTGLTSNALAPILLDMELTGRLTQQHGHYVPCRSAPQTRAEQQRRR